MKIIFGAQQYSQRQRTYIEFGQKGVLEWTLYE